MQKQTTIQKTNHKNRKRTTHVTVRPHRVLGAKMDRTAPPPAQKFPVHKDETSRLRTTPQNMDITGSPGTSGVPGTVLALAYSGLEDQLTRLYGLCFNLAHFPDAWKQGNLITILKATDKDTSDPKSLRPITLLSDLGKVLERIIKYAMLATLERRTCSTLVSSDLDLVDLRYMQ
ncbi:hypothetical protein JTB14_007118 [Gonioctena quinquepunctata]|nr:hypothetical protein JTB14_007118 [Gonioctena quinquepunctata]